MVGAAACRRYDRDHKDKPLTSSGLSRGGEMRGDQRPTGTSDRASTFSFSNEKPIARPATNTTIASMPTVNRMSPGARIQRKNCSTGDWMNSGLRAYQ